MIKNEEFENICKYIEEHKNRNKDHEVFINLSQFTKIKNHDDSEMILEMLKKRFKISKYDINGIDHLDIYLSEMI